MKAAWTVKASLTSQFTKQISAMVLYGSQPAEAGIQATSLGQH